MKKLLHLILIFAILCPVIGVVMASCDDESDCSIAGRATLRGTVYTMNGSRRVADTLDVLTITALGTDSIILNNQSSVTDVYLPLRYSSDTTTLVFHYDVTTRDTLTILHTNNPKFISLDCGYEMKQAVTSLAYTRHVLDSVYINSVSTNTDGTRNLELFY